MKRGIGWYLIALLMLGVILLTVSCSGGAASSQTSPQDTPIATPHTLEGRGDCLACHETGVGDAKQIPADHKGRTNDTCLTCHKPVA